MFFFAGPLNTVHEKLSEDLSCQLANPVRVGVFFFTNVGKRAFFVIILLDF